MSTQNFRRMGGTDMGSMKRVFEIDTKPSIKKIGVVVEG